MREPKKSETVQRSRLTLLLGLSGAAGSGACGGPPGFNSPEVKGPQSPQSGRQTAPGRDPGGTSQAGGDGGH